MNGKNNGKVSVNIDTENRQKNIGNLAFDDLAQRIRGDGE